MEGETKGIKTEAEINAQLEIVRGYYNRIGFMDSIEKEEVMDWLQGDLQHLESDIAVLTTSEILSIPLPPPSADEAIVKEAETIRQIAMMAWQGAANAFRMYPENKHTFSSYWDAAKSQFDQFKTKL
jgi:hypothetical protein